MSDETTYVPTTAAEKAFLAFDREREARLAAERRAEAAEAESAGLRARLAELGTPLCVGDEATIRTYGGGKITGKVTALCCVVSTASGFNYTVRYDAILSRRFNESEA